MCFSVMNRIPKDFKEAMLHVPVKLAHHKNNSVRDVGAKTKPAPERAGNVSDMKTHLETGLGVYT